jgi:hypothetical protein
MALVAAGVVAAFNGAMEGGLAAARMIFFRGFQGAKKERPRFCAGAAR